MRVHHVHHVVDGAFEVQHCRRLSKKLRRQWPDDVNPQHFPAPRLTAIRPSIMAACARCGSPAPMSPMAYSPFSAVSMLSPTWTNPRSSLAFDFSSPQPSVMGLRPTASS